MERHGENIPLTGICVSSGIPGSMSEIGIFQRVFPRGAKIECMSGRRTLLRRPLNDQELSLCKWLIQHGSHNAAKYAVQLDRVTVVGHCICGCPSVDLAVDDIETSGASEIIGDAIGDSPEGLHVGVILHCREGRLSELEVYPFENSEAPFGLPTLESLTSIIDESSR